MKKAIRRFILTNSILLCVCLIVAGGITVKQKSDYNMYRTPYRELTLSRRGESIVVGIDGESVAEVDFSFLSQYENKKKYLKYTPLGGAFYFIETAKELF